LVLDIFKGKFTSTNCTQITESHDKARTKISWITQK